MSLYRIIRLKKCKKAIKLRKLNVGREEEIITISL